MFRLGRRFLCSKQQQQQQQPDAVLRAVAEALSTTSHLDDRKVNALRAEVDTLKHSLTVHANLDKKLDTLSQSVAAAEAMLGSATHDLGKLQSAVTALEQHFNARLAQIENSQSLHSTTTKVSSSAPTTSQKKRREPAVLLEHNGKEVYVINKLLVAGTSSRTSMTDVSKVLSAVGGLQNVHTDIVPTEDGQNSREVMVAVFNSMHDAARALDTMDDVMCGTEKLSLEPYVPPDVEPYWAEGEFL